MRTDDLDVIHDRRKKSDRRVAQKRFEGTDRRRGDRRDEKKPTDDGSQAELDA